jgi:uncharacterized membrane protein YjgN (DUF898 family)
MALEELREGVLNFQTLKYKAKAVTGMIIGFVIIIAGIIFGISVGNWIIVVVGILVGLVLIGLSFLSFKSARHTSEVRAGMHGHFAQRRLMERERRN